MTATAELIADHGEACAGEDFFRSPPFLEAEGVTHTLRVATSGGELLAPLIVRRIPDTDERDAISPYGYPGLAPRSGGGDPSAGAATQPARSPSAVEPNAVDFGSTGLVSAFLRHALGEPPLAGATERNVVQIADPQLPSKSRPSDRVQIRRNRSAGFGVEIAPGPATDAEQRAGFLAAYEQTMRRANAAERYFFGAAWFDRILTSPASWLALCWEPEGEVAAAAVAVRSDGFLHYFLSGSADRHLRDSPMKNVVAALIEHSAELGLPFNLGGGLRRGDRLEEFKRGFANRELPWRTSEIVCDRDAYERLSAGREPSGFFPLYRSA